MDVSRGKTPQMLRREIRAHLLSYNLIRRVIAQAASESRTSPRRISFAGAKRTLDAFRVSLRIRGREWERTVEVMLGAIGRHRVGGREGRCEPRKVKRRPKDYSLLTRPRAVERAALLATSGDAEIDVNTAEEVV